MGIGWISRLVLIGLLVSVGCIPYLGIPEMTQEGAYYDETFGWFESTLRFNSEEIEEQQTADDVARIAAVSIHMLLEMAEEYDHPEYMDVDAMLPHIRDSKVRVVTADLFEIYCRDEAIACNTRAYPGAPNIIYLKNGSSYSCLNDYTLGHEFLHSLLLGINHPGNVDHSAPDVFVWDSTDPNREWQEDSAEDRIYRNPLTKCENN